MKNYYLRNWLIWCPTEPKPSKVPFCGPKGILGSVGNWLIWGPKETNSEKNMKNVGTI